ncbi:MAG: hypothetical protein ACOCVU_04850 [Desulfohalobiaceae bacterium]
MGFDADREKVEDHVARLNEMFRRRGGVHLQARAIWDDKAGRVWIRTEMVEDDGTRHRRQESPELTPEQAVGFVQNIMAALKRA